MFEHLNEWKFANPEYFYLSAIIPLLVLRYIFSAKRGKIFMKFSSVSAFADHKSSLKSKMQHTLFVLRILGIAALISALARPQTSSSEKTVSTEGIDIILSLDMSASMLAEDFKPNRLEAAKKTAAQFVDKRMNDRIGLVVFAGESYTQCPITVDHDVIKNLLASLKSGTLTDGTAIGSGLATAVSRLKESKAKGRAVILLTDGVNNTGNVAPLTAAEIARTFGIRVYTIGVGSRGMAPYPIKTPFGTQYQNMEVEIDETVMKRIAELTDGQYFRATDNKSLEQIYKDIDKLEKTKIDVSMYSRHTEEYLPFAFLALGLFLAELLLRYTYFRSIP